MRIVFFLVHDVFFDLGLGPDVNHRDLGQRPDIYQHQLIHNVHILFMLMVGSV